MRAASRMLQHAVAASLVPLFLATGCAPDTTDLRYRFDPSQRTYEWRFDATTTTDTPNEQSVRRSGLVVDITETITISKSAGQIDVRLDLVPKKATFDGRAAELPEPTSAVIRLDRQGRPLSLDRPERTASDAPQTPADPSAGFDRLIAEMRPPLPRSAVGIGDSWDASTSLEADEVSSLRLKGRGRLSRFTLEDRRKLAHITVRRAGSAVTQQAAGRAKVRLSGNTSVISDAAIDIEEGVLVRDRSRSTSEFDMALEGGGKAGTLSITVVSTLQLLRSQPIE